MAAQQVNGEQGKDNATNALDSHLLTEGRENSEISTATSGVPGPSPYATGGGGVNFAHRVAAIYLAGILTRERRPETSELPIRKVSFQTAPEHPVDDLLIECASNTDQISVAIACRATPKFVRSDKVTVKLVGDLLEEILKFDTPKHEVAIAVKGDNPQCQQMAELCSLARHNADAVSFKAALNVEKRWARKIRNRFVQFLGMVQDAAEELETDIQDSELAFMLLSRLHILTFKVQAPHEDDRARIATVLDNITADSTDGVALRERLEVDAASFDAKGAVVDLNMLRRNLHSFLKASTTRNVKARETLAEHRKHAVERVQMLLGKNLRNTSALRIPFDERRNELLAAIKTVGKEGSALLVSGESGTGKSALTLSCIAQLEESEPKDFEALVVNLRDLPKSTMELQTSLGVSVSDLLAELSAPIRVLVVDAADAAVESSFNLFSDLVLAANRAKVGVIAVSADSAQEFTKEVLIAGIDREVSFFFMKLLDDAELGLVSRNFPLLRTVLSNVPERSLLRRLVVLDLLVRTGTQIKESMSEWDCLELVWKKVIRAEGKAIAGSSEARSQALLRIAAYELKPPVDQWSAVSIDSIAIDELRREQLLLPDNPFRSRPEFAHDELRRYAVAIFLVQSAKIVETLQDAEAPRWALSAATLACQGQLNQTDIDPVRTFTQMIQDFSHIANIYSPRWADVPVEAVLDTSNAYGCLRAIVNRGSTFTIDKVVRIVKHRYQNDGILDHVVSAPVIQLLLDDDVPWVISELSFEFLIAWLRSLIIRDHTAEHPLRVELRSRLIRYWETYSPVENRENDREEDHSHSNRIVVSANQPQWYFPYQIKEKKYVECLALLGSDINYEVEQFLIMLADSSPSSLSSAADSLFSAESIAQYDPELLARLIEKYYIDMDDVHGSLSEGIRGHRSRQWSLTSPSFSHLYGGFWPLLKYADPDTSIGVLNNILNHAALMRVTPRRDLHRDTFDRISNFDKTVEIEGMELTLDGSARFYIGDSSVWSWYRGTSVGPYAATSALLAMERFVECLVDIEVPVLHIVRKLLHNCKNLAVPGMIYGFLVRHLDKVGRELDGFLSEPAVWDLETSRLVNEYSGLRAHTDELKNQERRAWRPHEVSMKLVIRGDEIRRKQMKAIGDHLVSKGNDLGFPQRITKNWAAYLDVDRYRTVKYEDHSYIEVELPKEVEEAFKKDTEYFNQTQVELHLKNRYWVSRKNRAANPPLTSIEISQDLTAARELLEATQKKAFVNPSDAVAQVIFAAIQHALAVDLDVLDNDSAFVARFMMDIALSFKNSKDQEHEDEYFDLRADRAVASVLPSFLMPQLTHLLSSIQAAPSDVIKAGAAIAGKSPLETRLFLARGCDVLWKAPCHGSPCIHDIALKWLLETVRGAEIGEWDLEGQARPRIYIEGDIPTRLKKLKGKSIDIFMLDAVIRGIGASSASDHCRSDEAVRLFSLLLDAQLRAIMSDDKSSSPAYGERHALVAARAILDHYSYHQLTEPVLDHLDGLSSNADILSSFLYRLAAAGAENALRAKAARDLWPTIFERVIAYADHEPNPFQDRSEGSWAIAALLPEPLQWVQGIGYEVENEPIDWVDADSLLKFIDQWILMGSGETKCIDALIELLRKLPAEDQISRGIDWISELCTKGGQVVIDQSLLSNEWLIEIRSVAEKEGQIEKWQQLVDGMVVAGNEKLAPFSR